MPQLDIILTYYNEPASVVTRFLESLKAQSFKNLKVTIVDDGLDCPELAIDIMQYPFEIRHLKKEHKTVSAARNFGLDNTTAQYLMFCDCDDMFDNRNPYGLERAISRIIVNDLCVYRSTYSVEAWKKNLQSQLSSLYKADDSDELVIVPTKGINSAVVHAKIYKRSFINEYKLRFLDDLWMNEDGVFNGIAFDICKIKNLRWFDDCEFFYIWKYNDTSVTRTNKIYPVKGYDQFLKATAYMYRTEHKLFLNIDYKTMAQFIFQAYYWLYLYSDRFIGMPEYDECMAADMAELKNFLNEFIPVLPNGIFDDPKVREYRDNYMKRLDKCDMTKKISLEEWLRNAMK